MTHNDYINQTFKAQNYTIKKLEKGEYDNCIFSNCVLSNTDLSAIIFNECIFDNCDLSMANLKDTALRSVKFKQCKLLGLRFDDCNEFLISFEFDTCVLNFSSFYKLKIKNTQFNACKLEEVEFVATDLTSAVFKNCDFRKAAFEGTILEKADLRSSFNFSINPETNKINKAKFSKQNIVGLLDKYNITIE